MITVTVITVTDYDYGDRITVTVHLIVTESLVGWINSGHEERGGDLRSAATSPSSVMRAARHPAATRRSREFTPQEEKGGIVDFPHPLPIPAKPPYL